MQTQGFAEGENGYVLLVNLCGIVSNEINREEFRWRDGSTLGR